VPWWELTDGRHRKSFTAQLSVLVKYRLSVLNVCVDCSQMSCCTVYIEIILWPQTTVMSLYSMLWDNVVYCVKLRGEDLSCYSSKIESVGLRTCPYYHCRTKKVINISQSLPTSWWKTAGIDMVWRNYITVSLCIMLSGVCCLFELVQEIVMGMHFLTLLYLWVTTVSVCRQLCRRLVIVFVESEATVDYSVVSVIHVTPLFFLLMASSLWHHSIVDSDVFTVIY